MTTFGVQDVAGFVRDIQEKFGSVVRQPSAFVFQLDASGTHGIVLLVEKEANVFAMIPVVTARSEENFAERVQDALQSDRTLMEQVIFEQEHFMSTLTDEERELVKELWND